MNAELYKAAWRKSTHSQANGACVEVTALTGSRIAIRDSKNPGGPAVVIPAGEWRTFLARVPRGHSA
jgi:hypothetical protein